MPADVGGRTRSAELNSTRHAFASEMRARWLPPLHPFPLLARPRSFFKPRSGKPSKGEFAMLHSRVGTCSRCSLLLLDSCLIQPRSQSAA